jgi:argininosuccinate lyase
MKLWQKDKDSHDEVTRFTVGLDRETDLRLARHDVLGSLAHIRMLESVGLLTPEERSTLAVALKKIHHLITQGSFVIEDGVEDVHSQVELLLTRELGDVGKKIHSGRSRNDQVLVDIKLFLRQEIKAIVADIATLFHLLQEKSEEHKNKLLPGYTHFQLAMPSSFGLWFGAYAESLVDDLVTLQSAYRIVNKNPLGSAAGYGSSFPLNRKLTTSLLGFADLNYNVVYAQMGRGKTERIVSSALANVAATLSKLSADACLYLNQNFGFVYFPDELTTGSSIMPHKKNPDVWELIRAHCNLLLALPNDITMLTANLPSGYHRDFQLLKERLFPAISSLGECLRMAILMIRNIQVADHILDNADYKFLFSVEEVNKLVLSGIPFRDAYQRIGKQIEEGKFTYSQELHHTHEGSLGNLSTKEIHRMFHSTLNQFDFATADKAEAELLLL